MARIAGQKPSWLQASLCRALGPPEGCLARGMSCHRPVATARPLPPTSPAPSAGAGGKHSRAEKRAAQHFQPRRHHQPPPQKRGLRVGVGQRQWSRLKESEPPGGGSCFPAATRKPEVELSCHLLPPREISVQGRRNASLSRFQPEVNCLEDPLKCRRDLGQAGSLRSSWRRLLGGGKVVVSPPAYRPAESWGFSLHISPSSSLCLPTAYSASCRGSRLIRKTPIGRTHNLLWGAQPLVPPPCCCRHLWA